MTTFSRKDTKIAKCVAVTLMVIHHLFAFPERFIDGIPYISIFSGLNIEHTIGVFGKLCVTIFVFLSGYGTYLSMDTSNDVSKSIIKKVYGLYKKYWSVFFIFVPMLILIKPAIYSKNPSQIVMNLVALKSDYNGDWWFFAPFIVLSIISPILIKFIRTKRSSPLMDFLIILFSATIIRYIFPLAIEWSVMKTFWTSMFGIVIERCINFIPAFLMGAAIAKYGLFDKFLSVFNKRYTAIPVSLVILLLVIWLRVDRGGIWDYIYAPLLIISSVALIRNIPGVNFIASEIGSVSTEIWLIHSLYVYHIIPKIVFIPKYSFLIVPWLLLLCYLSGKLIVFAVDIFEKCVTKIKTKKHYQPKKEEK